MGSTTRGQEPGESGSGEQELGERESSESEPMPQSAAGEGLVRPLPWPPDLTSLSTADRIPDGTPLGSPRLDPPRLDPRGTDLLNPDATRHERYVIDASLFERQQLRRILGSVGTAVLLMSGIALVVAISVSVWLRAEPLPDGRGLLAIQILMAIVACAFSLIIVVYYVGGAIVEGLRARTLVLRIARVKNAVRSFEGKWFNEARDHALGQSVTLAQAYDERFQRELRQRLLEDGINPNVWLEGVD